MPTFTYKAKDRRGNLIEGTMEADNRSLVVSQLQTMGYFPIHISDSSRRAEPSTMVSFMRRRIRSHELAVLNRQLADLLGSGVPLVRALNTIQVQSSNPSLRDVVERVNTDVQGGDSLAESLSKHPRLFSRLYCAMIKAGEAGGMLEVVLRRLAELSEAEENLKAKIKSAMIYPVVMIVASGLAVAVLMTVVVPKIVTIYNEFGQVLPLPTQMLISFNNFFSIYWWLILGGLFFIVLGLSQFLRTDEGTLFWHSLVLRIPKFGEVVRRREVAKFARILGSLLQNGVPMLSSLEITREVIGNRTIQNEVRKVTEEVTQGSSLSEPLKESTVFPPVVVSMVGVGEESGNLAEVLLKVADSLENEVDRNVKMLSSLIEPAIIIFMAVIVGFLVLAMLLPIFSLEPAM